MAETSTRTEIASQNQRSLAHPSFPKDIKPWNPQVFTVIYAYLTK
jgi:hypothetical protein